MHDDLLIETQGKLLGSRARARAMDRVVSHLTKSQGHSRWELSTLNPSRNLIDRHCPALHRTQHVSELGERSAASGAHYARFRGFPQRVGRQDITATLEDEAAAD